MYSLKDRYIRTLTGETHGPMCTFNTSYRRKFLANLFRDFRDKYRWGAADIFEPHFEVVECVCWRCWSSAILQTANFINSTLTYARGVRARVRNIFFARCAAIRVREVCARVRRECVQDSCGECDLLWSCGVCCSGVGGTTFVVLCGVLVQVHIIGTLSSCVRAQ